MTTARIVPAGPLRGEVRVPGDKSVSHRALLFNALATGTARVRGLLQAEDVKRTQVCCRALGVELADDQGDGVVIRSTGTFAEPTDVLDCGNSGTTIRLMTGVMAAESFFSVLSGDESLRKRPMRRVADPLRALGATIDGRHRSDRAPLAIRGPVRAPAGPITLEVASAQVKTALMLATRRFGVTLHEPGRSRDHTERMLRAMGATVDITEQGADQVLTLAPVHELRPLDVDVPGDLSSAAFWLVAGSIVPRSEIVLRQVGVNPTRAGVLDALRAMGADITVEEQPTPGAEPVATIVVRATTLKGTRIDGDLALRCLDELPVLAVAAAFAEGTTTIADAAELRVKESDRIQRTVAGLRALGVEVEERPDGMVIEGGGAHGPAVIDATGDHRIAMAFAVAGAVAPGGVRILGAEAVATSYPTFSDTLRRLRA